MGAFHAGHVSLMERARAETDVVVVSLFVNPTQFGPSEDLAAYPRDEARDAEIAAAAGVDVLFAPPVEEVYPDGFQTTVTVGALGAAARRRAAPRPLRRRRDRRREAAQHGRSPDVAFFGQKDAQQALIVRRVVRDLDIPVRIEVCPTVREPDGLAMSSRNAYLAPADRERAIALRRALDAAEQAVAAGERDAERRRRPPRTSAMEPYGVEPEYLALVAADTLAPVDRIDGEVLVALAARVGPARLIDNTLITRPTGDPETAMHRTMLKSKIHRATVTDADLHYVGSITVDPELLEAADILEHEQVAVVDVNNGARFETYTIAGERGSGEMKVNGAAARLVHHGDTIIVISYAQYDA